MKKNWTRIVALGLMLTLLLPMSIPVSAQTNTNYDKEARLLYDLGLFGGRSDTEYVPDLAASTNREQAMAMLGRVLGWKLDEEIVNPFTKQGDVSDWAKTYVAIAAREGITQGTSTGVFSGSMSITLKQLVSWISVALGYGEAYFNPETALNAGLLTSVEYVKLQAGLLDGPMNRDDLVGIFHRALTVTSVHTGNTLIENLVDTGVVTNIELCIEAGLISEEVAPNTIEDVILTRDHKIHIRYGSEPSENALDMRSYTVNLGNILSIAQNNNTVILSLDLPEQGELNLTIGKRVGLDEEHKVTLGDLAKFQMAHVTGVELVNPNTFVIEMSEELDKDYPLAIHINLDNTKIECKVEEVDKNRITVKIPGQLFFDTYTFKIETLKTVEGELVNDITGSLAYIRNREEITAKIVSATPNRVEIQFNQSMKTSLKTTDFYYAIASWNPDKIEVQKDGTTVVLLFTTRSLYTNEEQKITIKKENLISQWDNITQSDIILTVNPKVDNEPPRLLEATTTGEDTIILTFSKTLDASSATNSGNYDLVDGMNRSVTQVRSFTYDNVSNKVTIKFMANLPGGEYSIRVANIIDATPQKNKLPYSARTVALEDKTPPVAQWASIDVEKKTVIVYFNEPLGLSGIDRTKWQLGLQQPIEAYFDDGVQSRVVLKFKDPIVRTEKLIVGQIADRLGNQIQANITEIPLGQLSQVGILSARTLSANQIEIIIPGRVVGGITTKNILIYNAQGTFSKNPTFLDVRFTEANQTRIIATVEDTIKFSASSVPYGIHILANTVEMDTGAKVSAEVFRKIEDGIRPSLTSPSTMDGKKGTQTPVTLYFDEALMTNHTSLLPDQFTITYDGEKLVPTEDYTIKISGSTLSLDLKYLFNRGKYLEAGKKLSISGTNFLYITDSNGNMLNDFSVEVLIK